MITAAHESSSERREARRLARIAKSRDQKARWDVEHAAQRAAAKVVWRRAHRWQMWALSCIRSKKADGNEVTITWPEIQDILERQGNVCALTGLPFWKAKKAAGAAGWDSPSMDRISHGGPYSADNVRVVLHCINTFRGRLADDQMIAVAKCLVRTMTNQPQALRRTKRAPNVKKLLYGK